LKGYRLSCRIYSDRIDLYLGTACVHSVKRVHGSASGIQWRDLVGWLVRKPGAFAHYRYREALLPTDLHRQLHAALCDKPEQHSADREYLLILNASAELEPDAAAQALGRLLSGEVPLSLEGFREAAGLARPTPELAPFQPDLSVYRLFDQECEHEQQCGDVSEGLPPADDGGAG